MRHSIITVLILLLSLQASAKSRPNKIILEDRSVEASYFQILNTTGNGFILAKACASCPELRLHVTPNTKGFHNGKPASLQSIPAIVNFTVTVVYDPKSFTARRVYW